MLPSLPQAPRAVAQIMMKHAQRLKVSETVSGFTYPFQWMHPLFPWAMAGGQQLPKSSF
jgi:hypothetical protein